MLHLMGVGVHAPSRPLVMVSSPIPLPWLLTQPSPCWAMSAPSGSAPTFDASPAPWHLPNVWPPAVSATVSSSFMLIRSGLAYVARRLERIRIAARALRIDVDEAHLDRRERALQ